jgi:hypothetical protein
VRDKLMFSQVTLIVESALAHAGTVVSEGEVVIGVSPSERLSGGEDGSLNLLVVVTDFPVLAPARLIFALRAVVASIGSLILHLEDVVEATGVGLGRHLSGGTSLHGVVASEVVDVRVLLVELGLELLNSEHRGVLGLTSLFLNKR